MRAILVAVIVILLVGITSIEIAHAEPRTIVVPDSYLTIKDALINANDGDTVFIKKGTYQESNLIVNKAILIIGEDRESTIIIGQSNPYMLLVNHSQVTISGLTLIASNTKQPTVSTIQYQKEIVAIQIEQSQNCDISGNKIENSGNGVWLHSSSNNLIEGNTIWNNYYGMDITGYSTHNLIRNNDISSSQVDIRFSDKNANNNIVSANNITSAYTGLFFYFSSQNHVVGNYIAFNKDATHFVGSLSNVLHHNSFVSNSLDISKDSSHYDNIMVAKSINFWDDRTEGNYWSNYTGTGNNGIGNSPYVLNEFNKDNHPLLELIDIDSYSSYSSTTLPYPPITISPLPSINPTTINPTSIPTSTSPMPTINTGSLIEPFPFPLLVVALVIIVVIIASVLLLRRHRKTIQTV